MAASAAARLLARAAPVGPLHPRRAQRLAGAHQIAQLAQGGRGRGPGGRLEQAAVVADQGGIGPVGLVAAQLGAAKVLDLGRIDDTDAVSGIVEMERQAIAVASGCLQAGMHLVNPEILQPAQQSLPAFSVIAEDLGAAACVPVQRDIELLLGDVDAKPGGNGHFHVLGDICKKSRAGSAVRQPCTQGQV